MWKLRIAEGGRGWGVEMEGGGECRAGQPRKQGVRGRRACGSPSGEPGPNPGAAGTGHSALPVPGRVCDLGEVTPPLESRLPHPPSGDGRTLRVFSRGACGCAHPLKRFKGAINIHFRGTFRKSEAGNAPCSGPAPVSFLQRDAKPPPPKPRGSGAPAPPTLAHAGCIGVTSRGFGVGATRLRAPGAGLCSDRRAPVSASPPPPPSPTQRPGMPSGARMPHQGAPMGPPGSPYMGSPAVRPGLAPAGMEPARKRAAPPPGQSQAQSQGQPVPTAPARSRR